MRATFSLDHSFEQIPLARPDITEREIRSILEVMQTPYLSLGPKLVEFEEKFSDYVGVRHAIAVNSGTSGLHLAIKSLNIGQADAVITTPFSFIASANCILFERATPIFVDIDEQSFNIDPEKIERYLQRRCTRKGGAIFDRRTGKRVSAILPVHVFGLPCEMDAIMALAEKYELRVIEDACEAIGAQFDGKKVGTFGNVGVFAFYPNKQITTGEGGMIVTHDEKVALTCRSLRNQGRDGQGGWLAHSQLGYNYRISDINCALGIAQLERIGEILGKRAKIAKRYNQRLRDVVRLPAMNSRGKRSWFTYVICLSESVTQETRDEILKELGDRGIGCNNYFPPIHLQPFYVDRFGFKKGDFPVTESVAQRTIALSFHSNLEDDEIDYIVASLKELMHKYDDSFRRVATENKLEVAPDELELCELA
ncbi:DegT/DnrJ/EryC1/StrS family aminotransferase [candidate division KSB1 bacterium]|nr:DegT/DnrJ/EryC1/StrS family aminotransferase [candidate division KSB1 bacterium]NIR69187.1 DegT/DnrJ/EryC1/StrS family aminotransferase [candidate division KSB1 bacterium]NIS25698.1 DegT/DnrJ/EryC1/StrS family aminotransferase [candidate division KSB1 bacterium]NIT72566.1 DegT/DnrJ/EryC1/StrS family aminotransferase [candidate division KSB1 bacterium]NIU26375.1 DegT/DnrJ/EryC1/StrS family aminotransferase [candidate division KSB1 bacterium]